MFLNIDASGRQRVVSTIRQAERQTNGEIVVVVATQSDDYIHVPLHVAAAVALAVPLKAILVLAPGEPRPQLPPCVTPVEVGRVESDLARAFA